MEFIEAMALVNVRPELNEDGTAGSIVRKGNKVMLQVHELEKYVNIGAVEPPQYKYVPPVAPDDPTEIAVTDPEGLAFPKPEGGDA